MEDNNVINGTDAVPYRRYFVGVDWGFGESRSVLVCINHDGYTGDSMFCPACTARREKERGEDGARP